MECVDDLVDGGWAADTAYSQVNTWFRNEGGALQAQLHDSQARSGVRRQMRSMVKQALEDKD
ncbi:hypothetical protein EDD34_4107 [Myceligenerans xiligouense]|uniref:Uncharacterized protein n=2 Tax=Myceligenerans xiligouense TaxID=253184 RepID=A0A3N4YXQ2_9MICO|nr:hypothetical protein EDD34_4107 [Myceligenerans xiligouense]